MLRGAAARGELGGRLDDQVRAQSRRTRSATPYEESAGEGDWNTPASRDITRSQIGHHSGRSSAPGVLSCSILNTASNLGHRPGPGGWETPDARGLHQRSPERKEHLSGDAATTRCRRDRRRPARLSARQPGRGPTDWTRPGRLRPQATLAGDTDRPGAGGPGVRRRDQATRSGSRSSIRGCVPAPPRSSIRPEGPPPPMEIAVVRGDRQGAAADAVVVVMPTETRWEDGAGLRPGAP